MSSELDETGAVAIVTQHAQLLLSFCVSDKVRQTVCIRLARLFSDYGAEFGRRCAATKLDVPVPRVAVSVIENALADTEKRKPSWMGEAVDAAGGERETLRAGLVRVDDVENRSKDHR